MNPFDAPGSDWAEKHPFPPDQKRPAKLLPTTIPRIYGRSLSQAADAFALAADRGRSNALKVVLEP
jgi:hypothetical protein